MGNIAATVRCSFWNVATLPSGGGGAFFSDSEDALLDPHVCNLIQFKHTSTRILPRIYSRFIPLSYLPFRTFYMTCLLLQKAKDVTRFYWALVRCAFSNRILHPRMPLDPTHVRLKHMRVTHGILLGCSLLLSVGTVNCVQTLKANDRLLSPRSLQQMLSFHNFSHGTLPGAVVNTPYAVVHSFKNNALSRLRVYVASYVATCVPCVC
jgi:hypothetical protein